MEGIPRGTLDPVSEAYPAGMPSRKGLGHRGGTAALLELVREIDRSYKLLRRTAVLGLVGFLAQIVPCFT